MSEYDPYDMAIVGLIVEANGETAVVDFGGIRREIELGLVDAKKGDLVLVHGGYAIKKISPDKIEESLLSLLNQLKRDLD
ncbi:MULTISPECIES: HypC/HybG/HupF family hydrogenase formation chaperone [Metallosphaera]|uniref:Hydrogenase expression/formation protein (HUPF/HYPC) n=4 Tax=Metallosphaera TaxID=41980 RepID=A4YF87_METS5|nr:MULTISPECIES: HypC/HybG/HupF family hydrogenase formation chaperone [Metallosphaera]ABP95089.1 hydrogenase expression/formation protein (HUPF/HYPC) [Metallosphaera sedula DSM 5348]AIM27075.1 hydrogenase expression/formation protein (HUPF/HYPC) [Metallosphaera sedula]MCH1771950.1 HypC/HybG/HupF family hydrogenase formation chaperone [Metallosphaera sedula]MCP6728528.1 HypC/HybG/HupF family hydrogenase formation chaperone [Metallosphaera sedula]MCY0861463.1 HypC/HybG/HupF family hydrogenase f